MGNSGMGRKILAVFKYLVIIGLIAGLGALTWLERARRTEVEGQLESTRQVKMRIERSLKDLKAEKSELEGVLEGLKARARSLAARLAEEKETKESLSVEITGLEHELAAGKGEEEELLEEITRLKEEKADLEGLLEQIRLAKQALEEKVVTSMDEGVVELPEVVEVPGDGGETPGALAARQAPEEKVVTSRDQGVVRFPEVIVVPPGEGRETPGAPMVNRKFDLAVASRGKNDQLWVGDILTVHRKKEFIGKVQTLEDKAVTSRDQGMIRFPEVIVVPPGEGRETPSVPMVKRRFDLVVTSPGKNDGIRVGDILTVRRRKRFIGKVMVVKSPKAVVVPEAGGETTGVLAVNRKFNLIVASLGKIGGIRVRDILTIHRKEKLMGKVMVEEVRENLKAAAIHREWRKRQIKENDHVGLD